MKKTQAARRTPRPKRKRPPSNVKEYAASLPPTTRKIFVKLRATIRSAAPRGTTEIISYGIPALKHKKVLVWFAAFSKHCSLFPTSSVIARFKDELKGFSTSKGTIQFPNDKPLPTALIRKLVKARTEES